MVGIMLKVAPFITNKLGINIPALGLKKDPFGAACVTSLGMLNFDDATAPFSGFTNCSLFLSVCSVQDAPVV